MRHLKMLGLAAAVAGAVLASVGAGTASADFLCTKNETPCNNPIGKLEASITAKAKFATLGGEVVNECQGSSWVWEVETQSPGIAVNGKVASWSWAGCTHTTATNRLGKWYVGKISGTTNGVAEVGSGTGITLNTMLGDCGYSVITPLGTLLSGANPTVSVNATLTKVEGPGTCTEKLKFTASYLISNHTTVYVHNS